MFCIAELLWDREDFVGNSYPPEVCEKLLKSMTLLSTLNPASVIEGMTPAEFSLLCCAAGYPKKHNGEHAAVAELAAKLEVSVPAVSRTLRGLQEKGCIERSVDPSDRRSVRVMVTAEGEKRLGENLDIISGTLNRIMSVFTKEEVRIIAELYIKFAGAMAKNIEKK